MLYPKNFKSCILILSLAISACGGGGSNQQPVITNTPPTVSAGVDQSALASAQVSLSATASDSDGTVASYNWTQTAGDTVSLSDSSGASTLFVMPSNPTATEFSFTVTVTDNDGASASDSVTISLNQAPTVNAGIDQTVDSATTVNLNGTASDSDGTVVSYNWIQTAGDTVTLDNPNSLDINFVIPNNATTTKFSFTLTITDNDGASVSDSVTITAINEGDIFGKVTFDLVPFNTTTSGLDYDNTTRTPARGVLVEAIDNLGNQVESTITDGNGNYVLTPAVGIEIRIRISAHLIQSNGATWDVKVTDNTNNDALYVTEGELFTTTADGSERDFHLASGWNGTSYGQTRSAGPFAILDAIYDAMQKFAAVDPSINFPALEVGWSPNNSVAEGDYEDGDIGTSFYSDGKIYILGKEDEDSDEYDRHIVIHEWGHYFEDKLSRADSIGGPHGLSDRLDFRVAFGEGWGNALSGMITDDTFYRDSSGQQQANGWYADVNNNDAVKAGWFNEDSVQSILYDIYDNDSEPQDNIALGLGPIYSVLSDTNYRNQPYFTTIYTFIERLKNQQPLVSNAIDTLLSNQQIFGSADNGLNETNDGGIASVLPVYKTANIGGASIQVCSVNDAGTYNKLGNTAFITFQVTSTGPHTFTVTESGGATVSDPDMRLFKDGNYVTGSESETVGEEILTTNLTSTGTYQLEIYDWNNYDDTENAGSYCFDLQISN